MKSYLDGSGLQYILNKIKGVLTSHTHGNITSDGKLQTTDVAIASGDKIVITDASDSNKVARASISFNGSTTTKALSQKGTWENFESTSNKVTSITSASTNTQYPSAKCVYNALQSNSNGMTPLVFTVTSGDDCSDKSIIRRWKDMWKDISSSQYSIINPLKYFIFTKTIYSAQYYCQAQIIYDVIVDSANQYIRYGDYYLYYDERNDIIVEVYDD